MSVLTYSTAPLESKEVKSFANKVAFIYLVIVVDAVLTAILLEMGFGEVNPMMAWVATEYSPKIMAAFKILWSGAMLVVLVNLKPFKKLIDDLIALYLSIYFGGLLAQLAMEASTWTQ